MLPEAFATRMKEILGDEYPLFSEAIESREETHALRVNFGKWEGTAEEFVGDFPTALTSIPYAEDGFIYSGVKLGNAWWHHAGVIYLQDPSAMATVHALPVQKGWRVLDLCAAPGGKTSQLSAYVGDEGLVVANEYTPSRCKILQANLERLGCSNVIMTHLDTKYHAEWYPAYFDLVLVDAPCSGEGMFRKNAEAVTEWSPENVAMCAERQSEILDNAAKCVAPGGWLLYSTCTFAPQENEENVTTFLKRHADFEICSVSKTLQNATVPGIRVPGSPDEITLTRRFYPHKAPGEGQYIALLHRETEGTRREPDFKGRSDFASLSRQEENDVRAFLSPLLDRIPAGRFCKTEDRIWWIPEGALLPPQGVFAAGVAVGRFCKGRIEPLHHLFSAWGHLFRCHLDLAPDDPRVYAYLRGEEIDCPDDLSGYCPVEVRGAVLGGIKAVGGRGKNHYPKGLRILPGSRVGAVPLDSRADRDNCEEE